MAASDSSLFKGCLPNCCRNKKMKSNTLGGGGGTSFQPCNGNLFSQLPLHSQIPHHFTFNQQRLDFKCQNATQSGVTAGARLVSDEQNNDRISVKTAVFEMECTYEEKEQTKEPNRLKDQRAAASLSLGRERTQC